MSDFDKASGETYVYPINYPVRDYQFEIVKAALFKNTLVILPTGLGKTFIGAVLMYNYYRWYPTGKIIFMAPTKPLVAQQIEACYKIMGIPQEHTAEMTGMKSPEERIKLWRTQRVFFLTPQVLMNDLSRDVCPLQIIKLLVVDEAHRALGNHSYCQVIKHLRQQNYDFRVLALSATPGTDMKAISQVLSNLLIAHIELRNEDSPDILKYVHKRNIEKIVIPIEGELKYIMEKFYEILRPFVYKLIDKKLVFTKDEKTFTKYQILLARDAFRQNPSINISQREKGIIEGVFSICLTLYHANELLIMHGIKSFYNFLKESEMKSASYMLKAEFKSNSNLRALLEYIKSKFFDTMCHSVSKEENINLNSTAANLLPASHPKMEKLCEILKNHFSEFNKKHESTRVMIFSQYRDSVQEITRMLGQVDSSIKPISFIGHSTGQVKGLTQKEQLRVVKGFREGSFNTLISTCVGEEGLDIGEVDLIVCYDAPKSAIRLVQRMGRTGRKREGKIIVLVTKGKEEKDYNQSQYQRSSLNKALTKGDRLKQFLYSNNPRMIPKDINPVCLKLHMKVIAWDEPGCSKQKTSTKGSRKSIGAKEGIGTFFRALERDNYALNDYFMNATDKKKYEENFKMDNGINNKIPKPKFNNEKLEETGIKKMGSRVIDFYAYQPWYTTLQPCFMTSHSKQSKHLVELADFISLQEALGDNNSYEVELAPFLDLSKFTSYEEKNNDCHIQKSSIKINRIPKPKLKHKNTMKKGMASFLVVKGRQSNKLCCEKKQHSKDLNTNFKNAMEIGSDQDSVEYVEIGNDIEPGTDMVNLFIDNDNLSKSSDPCTISKKNFRVNQTLLIEDNAFCFPPENKLNLSRAIKTPPITNNFEESVTALPLTSYLNHIDEISYLISFKNQKKKVLLFSMFQSPVLSFIQRNNPNKILENVKTEEESQAVKNNLLCPHSDLLKKSPIQNIRESWSNKSQLIFSSVNERDSDLASEQEVLAISPNKNFGLGCSSLLLTPPESKTDSPVGSNLFNSESPLYSVKNILPAKQFSLVTSTPRPLSKDAKKLFNYNSVNVTPIFALSKQTMNGESSHIPQSDHNETKASGNQEFIYSDSIAYESAPKENIPEHAADSNMPKGNCVKNNIKPTETINFDLSLGDNLFAEIDLTSLVNSNNKKSGSSFQEALNHGNVGNVSKNALKLSNSANEKHSYRMKLNKFRRMNNSEELEPLNSKPLLSVTQVIDLVNEPSVLERLQTSSNLTMDKKADLSELVDTTKNHENNKPKIVKNLSRQFVKSFTTHGDGTASSTASCHDNLAKHVSNHFEKSLMRSELSKTQIDNVKSSKDGWINCNRSIGSIYSSKESVLAESNKHNHINCKQSVEDETVQFDLSLDMSSDSDDYIVHKINENNTIEKLKINTIDKRVEETDSPARNNVSSFENVKIKLGQHKSGLESVQSSNLLGMTGGASNNQNNKTTSSHKEDIHSSDDEIFDNLDMLALESNFSKIITKSQLKEGSNASVHNPILTSAVVDKNLSLHQELNLLSHHYNTTNSESNFDNLPLTTAKFCASPFSNNAVMYNDKSGPTYKSVLQKTEAVDDNSPLVIKKKNKFNVLDSSAENSHIQDMTLSIEKKPCTSKYKENSSSSSNEYFVNGTSHCQEKTPHQAVRKTCKKGKKKLANHQLLQLEADESKASFIVVSSDESESNLDSYDESFVDDGTQAEEYNVDMKAIYLQSVKSPLKKNTKFGARRPVQEILSQPLSGSSLEEDSFVVANDFIEYETQHLKDTLNPEDSILDQVIQASLETATLENEKRSIKNIKKRKRIMLNSSSEEEEHSKKKIQKFNSKDSCSKKNISDKLKSNDKIIEIRNVNTSSCDGNNKHDKIIYSNEILNDKNKLTSEGNKLKASTDAPDFELLLSDDEEDWLEIPTKCVKFSDSKCSSVGKSTFDQFKSSTASDDSDFKMPRLKTSPNSSKDISKSPKFMSKRNLSPNHSNFKLCKTKNKDSSITSSTQTSNLLTISSDTISNPSSSGVFADDLVSHQNTNSKELRTDQRNFKEVFLTSPHQDTVSSSCTQSSSSKDISSGQIISLRSPHEIERGVCILVDTCEICIAGLVSSSLRNNHDAQTYIVQVAPASYIISCRMAIYRLSYTVFANVANRSKLIDRIRNLLVIHDYMAIIVEKDGKSGTKTITRTSYLDSISCTIAQLDRVKVLFTEDQYETAEAIWNLANLERLKGHCIPKFQTGGNHFEQAIKFYRTVPKISCSSAIFLALNYQTIREAVNSDLKELMVKGKMTAEVASSFQAHFLRSFRRDMLPMSYQPEIP